LFRCYQMGNQWSFHEFRDKWFVVAWAVSPEQANNEQEINETTG